MRLVKIVDDWGCFQASYVHGHVLERNNVKHQLDEGGEDEWRLPKSNIGYSAHILGPEEIPRLACSQARTSGHNIRKGAHKAWNLSMLRPAYEHNPHRRLQW